MRSSLTKKVFNLTIIVISFALSILLALYISGKKLDMPASLAAMLRYFQAPHTYFEVPTSPELVETNQDSVTLTKSIYPKTKKATANADRDNHGSEYLCRGSSSPTGIKKVDAEAIYRWTDDQGGTQFSDTAPKDHLSQKVSNTTSYDYFSLTVSYPAGLNDKNLRNAIEVGGRAIYKIYAHYLPFNLMTKSKIEVQIFADKPSYDRFKLKYAPSVASNVDGFYSSSTNQAIVSGHKSLAQTLEISLHEITHAINAGNFGSTPKWYNEGMAEVLENIELSGSQISISPNASWASVLGNTLPIMGLSKLLESTPKDWGDANRTAYYANAWSLAYYLMQQRNADFMRLLKTALTQERCKAIDTSNFIDSNYKGGVTTLERDWRRWIQNGQFDTLRF